MKDNKGVVNQTAIQKDICMKRVVYFGIGADTGGAHGSAIGLQPVPVAKSKEILCHDIMIMRRPLRTFSQG